MPQAAYRRLKYPIGLDLETGDTGAKTRSSAFVQELWRLRVTQRRSQA